jgi:hypothetical protein
MEAPITPTHVTISYAFDLILSHLPLPPRRMHLLTNLAPIALGALLLFLIQPLMAKAILPAQGGAAGVWTACLVFYQCGLLAGYFYAFLLTRLPLRWQFGFHGVLCGISTCFLPIRSFAAHEPNIGGPELDILLGLWHSIGLPYLLLASTSPLFQSWQDKQATDPGIFRWFAISNLGSLLGLLAYPFVIEPFSSLATQQLGWTGAYILYLTLIIWSIASRFNSPIHKTAATPSSEDLATGASVYQSASASWPASRAILCVAFAACSTLILGASTTQMSQSGVVVPFLWILPLTLYLASFVICFHWPWIAKPTHWIRAYWGCSYLACGLLFSGLLLPIPGQIAGYSLLVFTASMACHAQVHSFRPPTSMLTLYYLLIALGGAIGGAVTSLIAPRVFNEYWEFHLGIALTAVLLLMCELVHVAPALKRDRAARNVQLPANLLSVLFILALLGIHVEAIRNEPVIERTRDFFGVVSVLDDQKANRRLMLHGKTQHGAQPLKGPISAESTLYFALESGVAKSIAWKRSTVERPLRIGIIGLGVGSLLAHAEPGDRVDFYEISPAVEAIARKHFSYLAHHQGDASVSIGDGRRLLAEELQMRGSREFDILVIDAFASDALPMHLLTLEAIKLYQAHLAPDGVIAFQITNRYLDLAPVLHAAANQASSIAVIIETSSPQVSQSASTQSQVRWAILFEKASPANQRPKWAQQIQPATKIVAPWTDDFGSLWSALR